MKVSDLIRFLERANPDALVLVPGPDNTYEPAVPPQTTTALLDPDGCWIEDLGEVLMPQAEHGRRASVVVLR